MNTNEHPLCLACLQNPAHPEAFGLCESCDDLADLFPRAERHVAEAATAPEAVEPRGEGQG